MARIDVQTLVLAFERRISELEKNPPDQVPTGVILQMLERSIDEIIKEHFLILIRTDLRKQITTEFEEMNEEFVKKTITNILTDDTFRKRLEDKLKTKIIQSIKVM